VILTSAIRIHAKIALFLLATSPYIGSAPAADGPTNSDAMMARLNQEIGGHWTKNEEGSNPANLFSDGKGRPLYDPKTANAEIVTQATIGLLTKYADLWLLDDPAKELRRYSAQPKWQVELRQWNGGVPVFQAGIDVFFNSDGTVQWVRSSYVPGLGTLDKTAQLSGAQAIDIARKHLASLTRLHPEAITVGKKAVLGISAQRDEPARPPRLVYRLTLLFKGQVASLGYVYGAMCDIDAHTGEVFIDNYLYPLTSQPPN
jgi:hypothetical protein